VKLQVYDLLGKRFAVLADGPKEPGIMCDIRCRCTGQRGLSVPPHDGKTVLTRRMVLVR